MKPVAVLFEVITIVGCLLGGLILLDGFNPAASAPQVAAVAAMAIAVGAIPYMLAGVFHRMAVRSMLANHFDKTA